MLKNFNYASHKPFRISCTGVFCKRSVLWNFEKSTGKHLCRSLFYNKVACLKNRLRHRYFLVNFAKFLTTLFLTEHLRWQLTFQIFLRRYMNLPEISDGQIILNAEHKNRTKKFKETSGLQTFKSFTSSRARVF